MRLLILLVVCWPVALHATRSEVPVAAHVVSHVSLDVEGGEARAEIVGVPPGEALAFVGEVDVAAASDEWVSVDPGLPREVRAVADLRSRDDLDVVRYTLRRATR